MGHGQRSTGPKSCVSVTTNLPTWTFWIFILRHLTFHAIIHTTTGVVFCVAKCWNWTHLQNVPWLRILLVFLKYCRISDLWLRFRNSNHVICDYKHKTGRVFKLLTKIPIWLSLTWIKVFLQHKAMTWSLVCTIHPKPPPCSSSLWT